MLSLGIKMVIAKTAENLRNFKIQYSLGPETERSVVISGTDSFDARRNFQDLIPRAQVLVVTEII